jgi:hypothetical protein
MCKIDAPHVYILTAAIDSMPASSVARLNPLSGTNRESCPYFTTYYVSHLQYLVGMTAVVSVGLFRWEIAL